MAIWTSTKAGNWSDNTVWGGTPATGDLFVINHAIVQDIAVIAGGSPPQSPTTLPTVSTSTGATVTSLPSGTYHIGYTFVDSAGRESALVMATVSTTALTNGTSKPRVTFPAIPAGISSISLYMDNTSGTLRRYATGITTTTYDLVSASWENGTVAYASATALPNNVPVTINSTGSLTINDGIQLTARGDLWLANASLTLVGACILEFDPHSATSPVNARYTFWEGSGNSQPNTKLLTSGTSQSKRAIIRTNSSASNAAARFRPYITAFGDASDSFSVNLAYCNITRIGDSNNHCIIFGPSSSATVVQRFDHCIFDTCSRVQFESAAPGAAGWSFTYCSWKNSVAGTNPLLVSANAALTTGTRLVDHCVFDLAPSLTGNGSTYTNNYFDSGWILNGPAVVWSSFDSNCLRNNCDVNNAGGTAALGNVTTSIIFADTAPTRSDTGTASAATGTTLTDNSKSWTANSFAAGPTGNVGWTVVITGGLGQGQCRNIISNTTNALTVNRAWDQTPDITSTYAIYPAYANPHFLADSTVPAGSTVSLSGNIFQFVGSDNNGDCFLHLDSGSSGSHTIYTLSGNIILPNVARDNSGTLVTVGADPNGEFHILHNTYFAGAQCMSSNEGVPTGMTGVIKEHKSNVIWCEPGKTYALGGAGSAASKLGPFKVVDSSHGSPSVAAGGGATDVILVSAGVSQADYNVSFGILSGYADQTFAGSGQGYQMLTSVAMGTHDLDNTDPQFVDRWRSIWSWGQLLGSPGPDPFQTVSDVRAKLKAANDPSDPNYNANYTIAAMYAYLKAGMAPQNIALHNAGHDGTDIGAASYQSARLGSGLVNGGVLGGVRQGVLTGGRM